MEPYDLTQFENKCDKRCFLEKVGVWVDGVGNVGGCGGGGESGMLVVMVLVVC